MTTPPETRKFCRDCHHVRGKHRDMPNWRCASPENVNKLFPISLVTGEHRPLAMNCVMARMADANCGSEGKWFQTSREYMEANFPKISEKLGDKREGTRLSKVSLSDL